MKIAINSLTYNNDTYIFVQKLVSLFKSAEFLMHHKLYEYCCKKNSCGTNIQPFSEQHELQGANFFISIGGDGTLLDSVYHVGSLEIPILGINTGRLGFLATSTKENIEVTIKDILSNNYRIEERTLLHLDSNVELFDGKTFALNDFAILKRDISSMIVVHTYIDGEFLNSYWADGLLVSTPAGSTAYSLSCGGPVVMPGSSNFIISPVCPHNLNVRPLVVSDNSVISFEIEGRSNKFHISLDSRSMIVPKTVQLSVKKENFKAKIVATGNYNYLSTLRQKLFWGNDIRN